MKEILLNPGPVNLSDRVRNALLRPDICHREQEFYNLQNSVRQNLMKVYELSETEWAAILLTGSGTAAMEAMLTSLVPVNGKVLIIENGVYGERLSRIAEIHHINHISLHHDWEGEIDLVKLEKELQYHTDLTHLAVVHHETTTGRLNQLESIAQLARRFNLSILVDAVSSYGAEEIKFEEWNISACAAAANKCLHGVPGVSFVICNRNEINQMRASPARTLYLDLAYYLKHQDDNSTPFTQSVQCLYALDEALMEMSDEGGRMQRYKDYWDRMDVVRDGLDNLEVEPMMKKEECSCVLNAFYLPENLTYQNLHDQLKQNGFVIYAGQGGLARSMFRVSCMGAITVGDMERFVSTFEKILNNS